LDYDIAEREIKEMIANVKNSNLLQKIVDYLYENFERYSWVGIYIVKGNDLILGAWGGEHATEHTKIPIGKGICGSAAQSGKIELIPDVNKDNRYLACFVSTRSEIVVPIKRNMNVVGEIDIDSDMSNAFSKQDAFFLEKIADMLGKHIC